MKSQECYEKLSEKKFIYIYFYFLFSFIYLFIYYIYLFIYCLKKSNPPYEILPPLLVYLSWFSKIRNALLLSAEFSKSSDRFWCFRG